ncbi:SpoIIE family protein phosphatase [Streptomyces caniscabiei]|uniref:ATP-binding SpoIIE family protein phosphatase n=1 Tax=Streptomyces caniscabiei TaxID=2746961 RepID=UPI0029B4C558|nr:SpoIIE family protein phosphatase [Streptomyces caniscabiei]MDX2604960.1 SpoIIE family protein phosphatase [Streptomyces caniscabiei]MDX2733874.1 SpoIIE family protein phosphatase [Streptomyces caniscabiei]MDX2777316.1 SpoIIE family protein phosphatase [Streptomyces caniscabiei]
MTPEKAGSVSGAGQHEERPPGPAAAPGDDAQGDSAWGTEVLNLVLRQAVTCVGGPGALVHRYDRALGRLLLVAVSGPDRASAREWADLSDEQDVAPAHALRQGGYAYASGDSLGTGAGGTAAVPLPGADGPIGVLSVLTEGPGEPDEARRDLLGALAGWTGGRLGGGPGTSPAPGSVAAGAERSVRVGELTAALAEAVTSRDVVKAVAEYVLPPFGADGLVFQVLEGGRLNVVGAAGYPEEFLSLLDGMPLAAHAPVRDVLRTRTPRFIEAKAEISRRYPTMRRVNEASPKEAVAFLPMIASGRAIGLCVVSFSRPRSFSNEERALLTALSGLVGQSLERARLYDVEHARARELQRGLLPRTLPRLPAAHAAARYLPAGRGEEVGGDWYDLIPLSADRVAMVIGDVMGHGIAEAATMGRLRTAVRTLADLEMPPDELFSRLNDLVSEFGEDFYATCLYAVFDPVARTCTYSLAGHPPPVVVHPDGGVHSPDVAPDPPLGAARPPFETHQLRLPDESLLVLCTDGLVESPTRDADQGMAQLRQILSRTAVGTAWSGAGDEDGDARFLEELCDTVVSGLLPDREQTTDDAGLLVVHARCTVADDVASLDLPNDPRAAGQAREYVRERLDAWGLEDLVFTTELLVSELVGNVVRHARDPVRLRLLRSRSLICEVYDGSLTTPRIRHASFSDEGGRGLQLVAALSRRWGARYLQDGKCIWTEQDLPPT